MAIDRKRFLTLALGMWLTPVVGCGGGSKKSNPMPTARPATGDARTMPADEAVMPTDESAMMPTHEGMMPANECTEWNPAGECIGWGAQPADECVEWDPSNECIRWE